MGASVCCFHGCAVPSGHDLFPITFLVSEGLSSFSLQLLQIECLTAVASKLKPQKQEFTLTSLVSSTKGWGEGESFSLHISECHLFLLKYIIDWFLLSLPSSTPLTMAHMGLLLRHDGSISS